ncbi:hypothetical protein [Nonomuraea sp. NPDC002799]
MRHLTDFGAWRDGEWNRLIDQLRHGDRVPFIGAGAVAGALPSGRELSRRLARKHGYPYDDADDPAANSWTARRAGTPSPTPR